MKLVFLGLSLSSSWGNGHATSYRSLLDALRRRGHEVLFLERDTPWYAARRDPDPGVCELRFYQSLEDLTQWARQVRDADAVIVGSYVPDGLLVADWALRTAKGPVAFYDLDTPVTLAALARGECDYLDRDLAARFDLYFSFSAGESLQTLRDCYGVRRPRPLPCSADPHLYRPVETPRRWVLSYLGTYSADRQPGLERLLLEPARRAPDLRFCVAGPSYPSTINWPDNVERLEHVGPSEHPAFYGASGYTLNLTRQDMREAGHSPSVRLFEAGACGCPVISDHWRGLEDFFELGEEIITAYTPQDVLKVLRRLTPARRDETGAAARRRVLREHTADHRAQYLEEELEALASRQDLTPAPLTHTGRSAPQESWNA